MMSFSTIRRTLARYGRSGADGAAHDAGRELFDRFVLPHVPAAYNLARWLVKDSDDAEDQVQEACVRAYRSIDRFHGADGRAWFLTIVRNQCYTFLSRRGNVPSPLEIEAEVHASGDCAPEDLLIRQWDARSLQSAIEALPAELREVILLREVEELSYKEIAEIASLPVGTVMSRLSRARHRLRTAMQETGEGGNGLS